MAKLTAREKTAKRVSRMRRFINFTNALRGMRSSKIAAVRMVDTSHGPVRVLEYGFDDPTPKPLFIDMHGGGFILMHADADETIILSLMRDVDMKVIGIDYPLAPEYPYPIAVEAIYEVIKYYTAHADELGIDASHIGIGGHSAGANLSTVTCMKAIKGTDFSLQFQVLDYPPLDLATDPYKKPLPKKSIPPKIAKIFNACYSTPEEAVHPYISPVFATEDDLRGMPPAMVIVAGFDSLHDEGVNYVDMLKTAGVEVEFHDFKEKEHGFTYKKSAATDEACRLMVNFIKKHFQETK
jgi:acetyl esterase